KKWGRYGGIRYSISRLLKMVTAFTTGHSITLLIGTLGWLQLPSQPVEVMIAFYSCFCNTCHPPVVPR
ncbi:MAG: HupE/UreJ family protein, partial [Bacteroidetes bacterium]|nr:HupE/UreJ family protein [Bacteroidota bacterium]